MELARIGGPPNTNYCFNQGCLQISNPRDHSPNSKLPSPGNSTFTLEEPMPVKNFTIVSLPCPVCLVELRRSSSLALPRTPPGFARAVPFLEFFPGAGGLAPRASCLPGGARYSPINVFARAMSFSSSHRKSGGLRFTRPAEPKAQPTAYLVSFLLCSENHKDQATPVTSSPS